MTNLNKLITSDFSYQDNIPVVSTRKVAERFEKRHDHVIRDIEQILKNSENPSLGSLIIPNKYKVAGQSREYKEYLLTKQGFYLYMFNIFGHHDLKLAYINKFDEMAAALQNQQPVLPHNYKEALEHLLVQVEKNEKLIEKIEQDAPKVNFANSIETSKDSILIGDLAKLAAKNGIKIGQNKLFQKLRDENYLMSRGESKNLPTQKSINLQVMEIKESVHQAPDSTPKITKTPKITGKGQIYFIEKIKKWYPQELTLI